MTVFSMVNPVMAYAWGSRVGISGLQHRAPTVGPEAELWMGAHPNSSSELISAGVRVPLNDAIAGDPGRFLGEAVADRFGPRLPFLLKVLSAAEPLSLQVHPGAEQARRGYDLEDAAGIDKAAPHRSYRDPYAKPEMIVALDHFEAMQGFRPSAEAAELIAALGCDLLAALPDELADGLPTAEAFMRLVEWPAATRVALVEQLLSGASAAGSGAPREPAFGWIAALAHAYPGDPGAAAPALLNYVALEPGQALIVGAGEIHAYLRGTGVEILGGSDNVIRGGLTPKYVSVGDLREVLDMGSRQPRVANLERFGVEEFWPAPFAEFTLSRVTLAGHAVELPRRGPEIDLCIADGAPGGPRGGGIELADDATAVHLHAGESAFVTATGGSLRAMGTGVLLRATPRPDDPAAHGIREVSRAVRVDT